MGKRPFVWISVTYILGVLVSYYISYSVLLVSVYTVGYLILVSYRKAYYGKWFLLLPLICFLGYLNMKQAMFVPRADYLFDEQADIIIHGTVKEILDPAGQRYLVQTKQLTIDRNIIYEPYKIVVYDLDNTELFKIGNAVEIRGTIKKPSLPGNEGEFHEADYYKIRGYHYKFYIKETTYISTSYNYLMHSIHLIHLHFISIYNRILPTESAALINSIVLGDKSGLDEDIRELYRNSGIAHILAISGQHFSIIGFGLYKILKKFHIKGSTCAMITICFLVFYCLLTGSSTSTLRAVIMISILMMASIFGRTYDTLSALGLSALLLIVINPFQILDPGFLFSFGAVIGMSLFIPIFKELIPFKHFILDSFYASLAANLILFPVMLYFFFELPIYTLVINLLLLPFMSLLVIVALIGVLAGSIFLPIGTFLMGTVHGILLFYHWICSIFTSLPYAVITVGSPQILSILSYYLFIVGIGIWYRFRYKTLLYLSFVSVTFSVILLFDFNTDLSVSFIDVRQGDGIHIQTPSNKHYLVDGGGNIFYSVGKKIVLPYLKHQGIRRLEGIFISHWDGDHVLGILEILEEIEVKYIFFSTMPKEDEEVLYISLMEMAKKLGIETRRLLKGDAIIDGEVIFSCLHPYDGYRGLDKNAFSMVLDITYKDFSLLLTGDIGKKEENLLLNQTGKKQILKIPHHGSKTSSSERFVEQIMPRYGIISSAKNNRYGHPHQEVVDTYKNYDTILLNTKDTGRIRFITNGTRLYLDTFHKE